MASKQKKERARGEPPHHRLVDGRADEPERRRSVREEEGVAPYQLEDPPQAEGDREDEED